MPRKEGDSPRLEPDPTANFIASRKLGDLSPAGYIHLRLEPCSSGCRSLSYDALLVFAEDAAQGVRLKAMPERKPEIGDIYEIKTSAGLAYVQYTHDERDMGELVRVLPGF